MVDNHLIESLLKLTHINKRLYAIKYYIHFQTFLASSYGGTEIYIKLNNTFVARFVRLIPITCYSMCALRWKLYGELESGEWSF